MESGGRAPNTRYHHYKPQSMGSRLKILVVPYEKKLSDNNWD